MSISVLALVPDLKVNGKVWAIIHQCHQTTLECPQGHRKAAARHSCCGEAEHDCNLQLSGSRDCATITSNFISRRPYVMSRCSLPASSGGTPRLPAASPGTPRNVVSQSFVPITRDDGERGSAPICFRASVCTSECSAPTMTSAFTFASYLACHPPARSPSLQHVAC